MKQRSASPGPRRPSVPRSAAVAALCMGFADAQAGRIQPGGKPVVADSMTALDRWLDGDAPSASGDGLNDYYYGLGADCFFGLKQLQARQRQRKDQTIIVTNSGTVYDYFQQGTTTIGDVAAVTIDAGADALGVEEGGWADDLVDFAEGFFRS